MKACNLANSAITAVIAVIATWNVIKFLELDSEMPTLYVLVSRYRAVVVICWLLLGQGKKSQLW